MTALLCIGSYLVVLALAFLFNYGAHRNDPHDPFENGSQQ
jgi:hypothetical protein